MISAFPIEKLEVQTKPQADTLTTRAVIALVYYFPWGRSIYTNPQPLLSINISPATVKEPSWPPLEPRYALIITYESGVSCSNCGRLAADLNKNGKSFEAAGNVATPDTDWLCPVVDSFA